MFASPSSLSSGAMARVWSKRDRRKKLRSVENVGYIDL